MPPVRLTMKKQYEDDDGRVIASMDVPDTPHAADITAGQGG